MTPSAATESTVLFICTGNYYRSRFSEALFNHLARRDGSPWRAFSRGVAIDLAPPGLSPFTRTALLARGIALDLTTPDRVALTDTDLAQATHRVALKEAEHRNYIRRDFPTWDAQVEYWHFHDLDCATAEEMLPTLATHVTAFYERLVGREGGRT